MKRMSPLEVFGLLCLATFGWKLSRCVFRLVYNNLLAPQFGLNAVNFKELGKWAVVTGATDGVGKAYAEALAKKGLNIVLISRTQSKLEAVARDITASYNVETRTIAVDFAADTDAIYRTIDKQLAGIDIGVLINNVGMSYPHPDYFLARPIFDRLYADMLNCNIASVTYMCRLVMPGMAERGRGLVVNVSSTAAQIPSPLLTVYSASKAYVDKFSADLHTEYSNQGIIVQCILPGYVATKMSKIRSSTWMAPSPKRYVADALKTVGVSQRTTGYFPHALLVSVVNSIDYISPRLSRWFIMKTMENIRKRAIKRVSKTANS